MKKIKLSLIFLAVLLFALFGISSNVNAHVRGMAAADCGSFIEHDRNSQFKFAWEMSFLSYLSALEWHSGLNKLTKEVTTDSIYYSILQNCKIKPLGRVDEALLKLYFDDLK